MGWRGSAVHWRRYETAYMLLAGLSTPLVLSVHTVVSFDFAVSLIPGWHATIFPPYFVAGAIYSGFAMVLTLLIPMRAIYGLKDLITERHLDAMAKVMLATGLIVFYGYMMEAFFGWYSANPVRAVHDLEPHDRAVLVGLLDADPLQRRDAAAALDRRSVRTAPVLLFIVSIIVNVGMWLERFVIIVTSLHRDFLPCVVGHVLTATMWDWSCLHRHDRPVPDAVLPLHPRAADDFDLRDARTGAHG